MSKNLIRMTRGAFSTFVLLLVLSASIFVCSAITSDDYEYSLKNGQATITAYHGSDANLVIPSTLDGYPVTEIGDVAFQNLSEIVSVKICDSVKKIGDSAFWHCVNLSDVELSEELITIGDYAFADCYSLKEFHIPEKVEELNFAFLIGCIKLESITVDENNKYYSATNGILYNKDKSILIQYPSNIKNSSFSIPGSVKEINDFAFVSCPAEEIIIPSSVISIGDGAFQGAYIKNVTIPDSVTHMGESAFSNCTNLEKVMLSANLKEISAYAFNHCYSLTQITIDNHIEKINTGAFEWCTGLTDVSVNSKVIDENVFKNCESLKNVTINEKTQIIGNYAFGDCENIENVYITSLAAWCNISFGGDYANPLSSSIYCNFNINGAVTQNIIIPEGVKNIGDYTFCYYKNIKSITLPKSITKIGYMPFQYCENLTDIYYAGSRASWTLIDIDYMGYHSAKIHFAEHNETLTETDESTGIKAEYRYDDFEYDGEKSFVVNEGGKNASFIFEDSYSKYTSFDISFQINGHTVQPDYDVTIKIPLPAGFNQNTTVVYYIDEDGNLTKIPCYYENGYIVFTVDHFSEYALVDESSKIEDFDEPEEPVIPDEPTTEPDTPDEPSKPACSCNCHKSGFMGFIWKILNFFQKLFKINQTCGCGAAHY